MICEAQEWNAHQRAVMVKEWLDAGERLTMAEIARRLGVSFNGAKYLMLAISVVQPYTEVDGEWQRLNKQNGTYYDEQDHVPGAK